MHVLAVAGDTLVTMSLAGSLFFSISPNAARSRVALYLLLTMAPFAVVAPLLGPLLDRSRRGRRTVVVISALGRGLACLSMARHLHGWLLFPEAFVVLVLSKTYLVTKSALVPATVAGDRGLVEANSRLALLAVVAGFVAAGPGALLLKVDALGAPWAMRLAAVAFAAAAVAAFRLAPGPDRRQARPEAEVHVAATKHEIITLSATATAVLRAVVGFLTFLVAFSFRRAHTPSWWFGAVLAASMAGSFLGAVVAPRLRRLVTEETIVVGALVLVAVAAFVAAWAGGGNVAASCLAGAVGLGAGAGKLAFDSIVQREAADLARGRAFARFETRFQVVWVLAAAVPVVVPIATVVGMVAIGLGAGVAAVSYTAGRRALSSRVAGAVTGPSPSST